MDEIQEQKDDSIIQSSVTDKSAPEIKQGWLRVLLFIIASLFISTIIIVIGVLILMPFIGLDYFKELSDSSNIIEDMGMSHFAILSLFQFGGIILTVWLFRVNVDKKSFVSLGFAIRNYKSDLLQGLALGAGLICIGFVILYSLDAITVIKVEFDIISFCSYLIFFFIVAFGEEIMFRGYILTNLCESMNKYVALGISSLIFAIGHLFNPNVSFLSFIDIFIAGILLGIYYLHRRNLWFPIGLHLTWNFFQGPVFGFEVSGMKIDGIISHEVHGNELLTGGEFGFEGSLLSMLLMIVVIVIIHLQYHRRNAMSV